jgi:tyrosinase
MFDGSDYSMSGNGIYEPHNCTNALSSNATPPVNCIPPGFGGGCVITGPFKEYTVNLAPVFPSLAESGLVGDFSATLGYEPRCLKRDVSVWVSSNWTTDVDSHALITENKDIYWFQGIMQGNGFEGGFFGVHAGGNYTSFFTFLFSGRDKC